jgi:hypothetical protein
VPYDWNGKGKLLRYLGGGLIKILPALQKSLDFVIKIVVSITAEFERFTSYPEPFSCPAVLLQSLYICELFKRSKLWPQQIKLLSL